MHAMMLIPVITLALAGYVAVGAVGVSRLTPEGPSNENYYANLQAHLERFEAAVHRYQLAHENLAPPVVLSDADGGLLRALGADLSSFGLPRYNQLTWKLTPTSSTTSLGLCAESSEALTLRASAAFARASRQLGWATYACSSNSYSVGLLVPLLAPAPEANAPAGNGPQGTLPPAGGPAVGTAPGAAASNDALPPAAENVISSMTPPDRPRVPPAAASAQATAAERAALVDAVQGQ